MGREDVLLDEPVQPVQVDIEVFSARVNPAFLA
jgi:hypothetical protein